MTQQERDSIGMELSRAAVFYDRTDLDKTKISMMIDVLLDAFPGASSVEILQAVKSYRYDQKNLTFPAPARLMPYLKPSISKDSQAIEITNRIIKAIVTYQDLESNFAIAREFVGEIGWAVIRKSGGWPRVVDDYYLAPHASGQFFAQMRDKVKSQLEIQNTPGVDMGQLLNGPARESKALPAPVEFTEQESEKLYEQFKGKPTEMLEQYVHALAKTKSLKQEGA